MTQRYVTKRSTLNISSDALGSSETFTGSWEDCRNYDSISFACRADQEYTLYVDFTSDISSGTVDSTLTYNGAANINEVHRLSVTRAFFRIRVVNGTSAQTYLSLDCMLGTHPLLSAPLNLGVGLDADAISTRPSNFADEVSIGRRSGVIPFTKFGYSKPLTSAAGEETIWTAAGNFSILTSADTFTITYNNATDGSGTTGATLLFIQYIDANGEPAEATHTLGNTGSDVTSFTGLGINRVAVALSGSANINNDNITLQDTGGATTQAYIVAGEGVTQQCIYHVGSNSDAVANFLFINANKLSGGGSPRITIKAYVFNRTVSTQFEVFRYTVDTSTENSITINEPVGFSLSPSDVLFFVADTDTNNAVVTLRFSLREYIRN